MNRCSPSETDVDTQVSPGDEKSQLQSYYNSIESRLGYKLVLGDTRHFGHWEHDTLWPFPLSQGLRRMEDKLAEALGLGPGARVLDAGCGVGHVAIRMARQHELLVKGIDLVDYHIAKAKRNIAAAGLSDREVTCELMDYHHLDNLEPSSFDGIYTMETFVHARNPKAAIEGFRRLLRPGGRIAMFEYENCAGDNPSEGFFNKELSRGLQTVNKYTAMPNNERSREEYEKMLQDAGFCDVKIEDYSKNVRPMTRFFFLLALIPYLFIRLFGLEKYFINTMGGVGVYVGSSHWSYLAISATKSIPATKLEENKV